MAKERKKPGGEKMTNRSQTLIESAKRICSPKFLKKLDQNPLPMVDALIDLEPMASRGGQSENTMLWVRKILIEAEYYVPVEPDPVPASANARCSKVKHMSGTAFLPMSKSSYLFRMRGVKYRRVTDDFAEWIRES
jgi:hypothetical protein